MALLKSGWLWRQSESQVHYSNNQHQGGVYVDLVLQQSSQEFILHNNTW